MRSLPLAGEGRGGGYPAKTVGCGTATPNPSERALLVSPPQGGGEQSRARGHSFAPRMYGGAV
ncbi:ATP-dependent helicase HrpB (fragment) [Bradyrhizobium sp. STM 3843]